MFWDREDYCKEAFDKLGDSNHPGKRTFYKSENRLNLLNPRPRLGRSYLHFPKIQKRLEKVPGRPVISNCKTVAE